MFVVCNTGATNGLTLGWDCLFANQWQIRKTSLFLQFRQIFLQLKKVALKLHTAALNYSQIYRLACKRGSLVAQLCGHFKYCKCAGIKTLALDTSLRKTC